MRQIWHNPRCSKSRQTLEILQSAELPELEVVDYLNKPPSIAALRSACAGLGMAPQALLRRKDALAQGLELDQPRSDADWLQLLHDHPRLIERPVVCIDGAWVLGRPPENVRSLLNLD